MRPTPRPAFGVLALLLLLPVVPSARAREDAPDAAVLAGAWTETKETGAREAVVALLVRPGVEARGIFLALSSPSADPEPGDYGTLAKDAWQEVSLAKGELVLVRHAFDTPTIAVAVTEHPPAADQDVHAWIDGGPPAGTALFDVLGGDGGVRVARHVLPIGESVDVVVPAPSDEGFFREETLEIVRVARHLAIDGDDPDGPRGYVGVAPASLGDDEEPALRVLEGAEGEQRIRRHFTNPRCPWAERHVGWMKDLWILEYLRPADLRLTLDTSTVKAPGRVSDLWRGYGAVTTESIWPNGFGGSSANLDLPCLLVVPPGTRTRTVRR